MSQSAVAVKHDAHDAHHSQSFISTYIFSFDHKMIGKQFLLYGIAMLALGGLLALLVRWQLAWPAEVQDRLPVEQQVRLPIIGGISDDTWSKWAEEPSGITGWLVENVPQGLIQNKAYNAFFTMHATIMIFFVVMPILVGGFGNFLIPLMIGARDMAFPVLNMLSFWVAAVGAVIMVSSFFVEGGPAAGGWTSYPPLASREVYTGVGLGQDLWIISLLVLGVSSLLGSINYVTTVINMRAPGMTWFRLPLVIWSLWITAILLLLSLPVLTSALGMLLFDRMFGTTFFLPFDDQGNPLGGQPILWQHLFWFFGHPEVYILILPGMGIASELLAVFARKPIFGYRAMAFSMIGIAFLSWIVWGHHMFQSGMNPALGMAFMTTTMVIAVPSAIKTFNWLGTLWGGNIRFTVPMLHALAFVSMFVIGGLSGIYMANTPVDIFIHDTYFIVAHIHYVVFGGSVFAIFGGIHYWYPKMFGRMMNDTIGKVHFWITLIAFNGTFFPMHILGVGGHMRRIANPLKYEFLADLQHWNVFITVSAIVLGFAQFLFWFNFLWSMFKGPKADKNPWHATTLEWEAPTPPPHGNFDVIPTVYNGPYEYSVPGMKEDFLPQAMPAPAGAQVGGH